MTLAFATADQRAGTHWLATDLSASEREALLVALFSRFNHDLRTPLNTIMGWTHLLQQGSVDPARSQHVADVLARNAREQTILLEDFVDDGRAVLGVLRLDTVPLAFGELVDKAIARAAPLIALQDVSIEPDVKAPAAVAGDERRLGRLAYRLLAAVVRRARDGSTVAVTASCAKDRAELRVSAAAASDDWPDAALLDLKISSFVAALHGATLALDAAPKAASIVLSVPVQTA